MLIRLVICCVNIRIQNMEHTTSVFRVFFVVVVALGASQAHNNFHCIWQQCPLPLCICAMFPKKNLKRLRRDQ